MTVEEKIQFYIAEGKKLRGASIYYREDWECYYFDISGKYFALLSNKEENRIFITLKNLPDINQGLRESYRAIIPGYYTNKLHWNSIDLASDEIPLAMLTELIKTSYKLVFDKLPKKVKETFR